VRNQRGAGSGIVTGDGATVLTNAHVVGRNNAVQVELWDGQVLKGQVTGRHQFRDLALVRIAGDRRVDPAVFATAETLRPGAFVMAVGNPLGFIGALSTGVVHAVSGEWIQASVRLAPGNSGGPLANAHGQVVGINTMAAQNGRLALAIPSDVALDFLRRPQGTRLGITVIAAAAGLVITSLEPGGAAARASLLAGDVLVNYRTPAALRRAIEQSPDGTLRLEFQRGGKPNVRAVWIAAV